MTKAKKLDNYRKDKQYKSLVCNIVPKLNGEPRTK